jgi:WD40 repeat protein
MARRTLREALESSRIRRVTRLRRPALGAVVRQRAVVAVTTAGTVVTANSRTGRMRERIETGVPADAASLSTDGAALLTGADGRPRLVRPGRSVMRPPGIAFVRGAELSGDGERALVFNQFGARLVGIESGRVLQTFPRTDTLAATISRDGKLVATGHAAKTVRVWTALTGERILKLFTHVGDIVAVAISPAGDRVASANTKGIAQVWQIEDGKTVAVLGGHAKGLTDVAFNRNGRLLVTASRDGTVRVSDVDASTTVAVLRGHAGPVKSATFTATGLVVSASVDGTVRLWDARPESELRVNRTLDELMALADRRLAATGRRLTTAERRRYLG